jgi:glycosyltransferase involved in cell wall biosynthesis
MRLLYMTESFWPRVGGIEGFSRDLLVPLAERGVQVTVLTSRDDHTLPAREQHLGIDVRRLNLVAPLVNSDIDQLVRVRRAASAIRDEVAPDVLHVAYPGVAIYYALRLLASVQTPTLLRLHGAVEAGGVLLRRGLDAAAWITVNSAATLAAAMKLDPSIAARCSLVSAVVVSSRPTPLVALPFSPPVLVAAGRLVPEKGFDILLEALAQIRRVRREVRLLLGGDGPERLNLEAKARATGVHDALEMHGWVQPEKMNSLLDRGTVVAVPSRSEPFGRIAVEAALRGRPVVASRTGGLPEAVGGDDTGSLVTPGDASALALAVLDLMQDPARAMRIGAAAHQRALAQFPPAVVLADVHERLYSRLQT